jgi:hypothetical protein
MSTHDSKNGLSNRGRPRLEVSPWFNGEESEFCPRFTPYTHAPDRKSKKQYGPILPPQSVGNPSSVLGTITKEDSTVAYCTRLKISINM